MSLVGRFVEVVVSATAAPLFAPDRLFSRRRGLTPMTAASVDAEDAAFAVSAAESGLAEVALSELALDRAEGADLRVFARRMVADHTSLNAELTRLGLTKRIALPLTAPDEARHQRSRLAELAQPEFEPAFLRRMIADHEQRIAAFTHQAEHGRDPELSAFAARALPVLEEHLDHARSLAGETKHDVGAAKHGRRRKTKGHDHG